MEMENKKEEKKMGIWDIWDILKKILDIGNKNDGKIDPFLHRSKLSLSLSLFADPFLHYGSFSSYFNRFGGDDDLNSSRFDSFKDDDFSSFRYDD